jgi:16S rRNA (guanine527-N7)-methyltransferase
MKSFFKKYSLPLNEDQEKKLDHFLALFIEKNKVINLSAIRDETGIIEKHFIDSLMITKFIDMKGSIGDLGTWGGFPWIPLALYLWEQVQIDCIDSIGKKVKVVEDFAQELALSNVAWVWGRAEELAKSREYFGKYDILVSRAVAYFPVLLWYGLPLVKKWGLFIAYKLENEVEIKEGGKLLREYNAKIEKVEHYEIEGQKRSFIFVRKE